MRFRITLFGLLVMAASAVVVGQQSPFAGRWKPGCFRRAPVSNVCLDRLLRVCGTSERGSGHRRNPERML